MALDFPSNPTNGQVYTDGNTGIRFVFNSTYGVWRANGTSAVIGTASDSQILFNSGGLVRGSQGLVFSNTANVLYIDSANVTNGVTTNTVSFGTNSSKDKIRLYDSEIPYAIGMANYMTFGPLRNDWAMTFQMNDDIDRGFWWGDSAHTNAQGAMALTTDGNLYVASKIRLGFGETDAADQETWIYNLDVKGNVNATAFLVNGVPYGGLAYDKANTANIIADLAFNKANSANLLAFQVGGAAYDKANAANILAFNALANNISPGETVFEGKLNVKTSLNTTSNVITFGTSMKIDANGAIVFFGNVTILPVLGA